MLVMIWKNTKIIADNTAKVKENPEKKKKMEDKENLIGLGIIKLGDTKEKEQEELLEDLMSENQQCH